MPAVDALPTHCEDPAAGVWLGRTYRTEFNDWFEFTLTIHRRGSHLSGSIESRFWSGEPTDPRPSLCYDDSVPALNTVDMIGAGQLAADGTLTFSATRIRRATPECGSDRDLASTYALDSFTGQVGSDDVFRAGNTDGAAAFNRRYDFTRVSCE